ncbi:MAG: MBOAT family protein [Spirochaetaceae bacterium]|nr:MAG: MBOAT family protein [Spirochaetaceae bacterium]
MIFSTTIFVFLFLPLFLIGYYALPFRLRSGWILLGSWIFYAWWRADFLALIIATTIWTYLLGGVIVRNRISAPRRSRSALALGVVLNLGILAYFKYFNFGVDTFNALLELIGIARFEAWRVILPIGISFYVFQATSYLVDLYRRDAPAAGSYVELAAYISLFPQLIAGPILRYKDLAHQFRQRNHSFERFSEGAYRFMIGFCRKVLIADSVAAIADTVFALQQPGFVGAWLGALAYTAQLYFDFTGYSDMAIGLGLMMGFRFMENFNYPYISRSITEFWRRWHISLSTWLRDYLYIPLGGNRRGPRRTYINIMLVMLLGGLWHGAAWTFVIWGAWHGIILAFERLVGVRTVVQRPADPMRSAAARLWAAFAILRTMLLVIAGWVVFRAPDFSTALALYRGMLGLAGRGPVESLAWQLSRLSLTTLAVSLVIIYVEPHLGAIRRRLPRPLQYPLDLARVGTFVLFTLAVIKLQAEAFSPFLYYQF